MVTTTMPTRATATLESFRMERNVELVLWSMATVIVITEIGGWGKDMVGLYVCD